MSKLTKKSKKDSLNIGILDPMGYNKNPLTGNEYTERYKNLSKVWSNLPAYNNVEDIIDNIKNHNVILVVSGTGSGKTVLFPKYVLHAFDYNAKIAITLPKQDATESAARYSADMLDVNLGEEVGFQFRNSGKNTSSKTKLLYCTDGTLVARLLTDPQLNDFDAVIVDEAHERKVNIDFLLYLLKNVLISRPAFKLVIMSATINESIFRDYFKDYNYTDLAIGTKPNYPIESIFLDKTLNINKNEYMDEGIKIIKSLLKKKSDSGGILFFVTSVNETNSICEILNKDNTFHEVHMCISVYSGMDKEQNKLAKEKDYYRQFTKDGRKIIVATNVAESSLTIEGIKYVIDSGIELKSRYEPIDRIHILEKTMITHAQAKQRMGRTGRTEPGICYHLYTKEMMEETILKFPIPAIRNESINYEMLRLLSIDKISNIGLLKNVFDKFIEPPDKTYIDFEINYLKKMDLIDSIEDIGTLTNIGKIVSDLQLEPYQALTLIMGYILNCFREVAGILSVIDACKGSLDQLFISIDDDSKNKDKLKQMTKKFNTSKEYFSNKYGDHIAILKIFGEYEKYRQEPEKLKEWAYKYFLKRDVLEKAYHIYQKMKNRYRNKLTNLHLRKPEQNVLQLDIKYRIMASTLFGSRLNLLKVSKEKVYIQDRETTNTSKKQVQIDKSSFITDLSGDLFYHRLYRYNNNPVKAQIVTKISKKSKAILKSIPEIL